MSPVISRHKQLVPSRDYFTAYDYSHLQEEKTLYLQTVLPRGGRPSCLVYCSTLIGLNPANFEIFTGGLSHQYRSLTHKSELKMVTAFVIPPQERKGFHLFLLKHLNVDLKIELFLLQWIWLYFLFKSTSSFLEFYTVEPGSLTIRCILQLV